MKSAANIGEIVTNLAAEVRGLISQYLADGNITAGNRLVEIGDQLTREIVSGCSTLDELLSKWTLHGYRPTLKDGPTAQILADVYDFVAARRGMQVTAYRGLGAQPARRDELTTIAALEGAIDMLAAIRAGKSYPLMEYIERLQAYEEARDRHRRLELAAAAGLDEILRRRAS